MSPAKGNEKNLETSQVQFDQRFIPDLGDYPV
jgi:hypothetical protein